MITKTGVVVSIIRSTGIVNVKLTNGPTVEARTLGDYPPPRSLVETVEVDGYWTILGVIGERRVVLRDDFTTILNPAGTTWIADTAWTQYGTGTAGGITGAGFGGYQGYIGVTTTTTIGQYHGIRKLNGITFNVTAPSALWFSGAVHINDYSQVSLIIGLDCDTSNDFSGLAGADAGVSLLVTNNTGTAAVSPYLRTVSAGTGTNGTSPTTVTTFFDFDIVMCSAWAALWVNGIGPAVNTTNVPTISESLNIAAAVYPYAASARALYVDYLQLVRFTNVQEP